jgi:hypothetical protein
MEGLDPYTVYAFNVQAVNEVGQSRPSKQSYPAITLMESMDEETVDKRMVIVVNIF